MVKCEYMLINILPYLLYLLYYYITHVYLVNSSPGICDTKSRMQWGSICIKCFVSRPLSIPVFTIVQFIKISSWIILWIAINEVQYKRIICLSVSFSSIDDLYLISVLYYTVPYFIPALNLILKATIHGISVIWSCW